MDNNNTNPSLPVQIPLHDYQQLASDFLMRTPKAGLFLDVGFGKTLTTLITLLKLAIFGLIHGHILIIAPKPIARSTWIDELKKWNIPAHVVSLIVDYDPDRYERELNEWKAKVDLITYVQTTYPDPRDLKKAKGIVVNGIKYPPSKFLKPNATEDYAEYKALPKRPPKDRPLSREQRIELYKQIPTETPSFYFINRELVIDMIDWMKQNRMAWPFPTIIIDELQAFKSYDSMRFKKMRTIMPYVSRFIGLTGTPVPNGLMDLWPEIYFMDNGARLGHSITEYRNIFFREGLTINNIPVEWIPKPGAEQEIYRRISDLVISIKNPNLNLPPITYNNVYCYMDDEEMALYKELVKESVLELQTQTGETVTIEADNAAILTKKLEQMASGTLYLRKGEKEYTVIHRRKLEMLQYIIDNTTSPVLVAYYFQSELTEIVNYLTERNYNCKIFDGSPNMIDSWNNGEIPIMLLQPASAGHGINIQHGGHTLVWYTVSWSLEHYIQCNGRLYRQGQQNPVMIHHLLTKGTIDIKKLKTIGDKDTSEKSLMDAVSATIAEAMDV